MKSLELANKCSRVAKSCVHREQVIVALDYLTRALKFIEEKEDEDSLKAIEMICDAWTLLTEEQEQGILGDKFQHIN